jgi:hypothetical protein
MGRGDGLRTRANWRNTAAVVLRHLGADLPV